MKELIHLHLQILALPEDARPETGVNFSREEDDSEGIELLPDALQAEVAALRQAINATLPEDFDYFAFAGDAEEGPSFSLEHERMPAAGSEDGTFHPERSLVEQLRELDWEAQRADAGQARQQFDSVLYLTERMSQPLPSAKGLQREFREETRDFIKEKRVIADRIHLLYWEEERELMEADFADGDALRAALPDLIAQGADVITVVVWGKPLPVERIDALLAQGQKTLREQVAARLKAVEAGDEQEGHGEETLPGSGESV